MSDPLDAAWTAVRARWSVDEAHRAFLELCEQQGRLGDAARRYREAVAAAPDDASARAGLERVLARAMSTLTVASEQRNAQWIAGARRTWIGLLVVMAVAVVVAFAVFYYWRLSRVP